MSKSEQSKDINELYYGQSCSCCGDVLNLSDGDDILFNADELVNKALINIFSNTKITEGIEPNLWKLKRDTLNKAVDEGFGIVDYDSPDFGFVQQLKHNNDVFSAFAVHDQTAKLQAQLVDADNRLKSFSQFKKDTAGIIAEGHRHTRTEYNTAIKRARSAAQFKQFQRTAHLYSNITWTPSRAAIPDAVHRGYWGTTLPISHPFWLSNFPGSRWNCKCGWEVTDAEVTKEPAEKVKPVPGLDENPVQSGSIFSQSHPHFKKVGKKKAKAINRVIESLGRSASLDEKQQVYALPLNKQYKTHISFNNGGKVEVHKLVKPNLNDPMDDFKDRLNFAIAHAKQGHKVKVLPEIYKSEANARTKLFPGLKNTKSNPDFLLDDKTYADLKRPSAIKNITGNANGAYKQGSVAVISDVRLNKELSEEIIKGRKAAILGEKNKEHYGFDELFFYVKGKVIKYNRQ